MRIEPIDEAGSVRNLSPDILWDGQCGDIAITALTDPINPAGLRAEQSIATAVLICLQTEKRAHPSELPDGEINKGWPGDSFDMDDDVPLGSKLWLLRRRTLTQDLVLLAEDYAREALQPLIDERAFVRFDVSAQADFPRNRLTLEIAGFGRDGNSAYHDRFAVLWDDLDGVPAPLT